ncbi:MAG: VWA domain-containing protein [Candidatus Nanoarchaeia archaeon]|nr:VWA domain-containing protein [Candidatus Nanoarchaeia archaeon]MDD5740616.1 VWA domain-containing protein [Candidatus Nanoarchaeia archaeon]
MIKQKRSKNKKAIFFSLDALIALGVILLTISVIYPIIRYSEKESYVPEDIISSLSALKIGDMDSPNVIQWIADRNITNLNKTVLEQIGEFYVDENKKQMARTLAEEVLLTINTGENIGIWYDNELLASSNTTSFGNAKDVIVERQTISGIKEGNATTGYSARAFLTNSIQSKYYYFGGYVGEGNITINVEYNGSLEKVELEVAANKRFNIYINGVQCFGSFQPVASEFEPKYFDPACEGLFNPGLNTFKIIPENASDNLHIAGGYLKITYSDGVQYEQPVKYYFPGIEGLINLYDGFYVPGDLNKLNIYLHFKSNYTAFLTIGNESIYQYQITPSTPDQQITLSPVVDYNDLSRKTIPIRFRLANVSYTATSSKPVDAFSVTDISGSMASVCNGGSSACCNSYQCNGNQTICGLCGGTWFWGFCWSPSQSCCDSRSCTENNTLCSSCGGTFESKIGDAKEANKEFINSVLNNSQNRVGLAAYSTSALDANFHALSNDNNSLINEVNSWDEGGSTCICCGINKAINALNSTSTPDNFRSIVVMSDGEANVRCWGGAGNASGDTIASACNAWKNYSIKVYTIGFDITPGSQAELTLNDTARCGNGSYYLADISNLIQIYQQVAHDILEAAYNEQTIEFVSGDGGESTVLYPDSYIEFNYTKENPPYGLVITEEQKFSDNYTGSFNIPANSSIVETKVISYSGSRWTSSVEINNTIFYNLSRYGSDYIKLGDPYTINIPNSLVGQNNTVRLTTGVSPTNTSQGSSFNKIVYTILKNMVSYSAISQYNKGCNWTVQFEDDTYLNLEVPAGAIELCYYKNDSYGSPGSTDALQTAIYKLFKKLDSDNDGRLDIKFTEQNLQISSSQVIGIPFPYETEVQVRKWW